MVAGCDRLAACLTMPSFGQCILHMFHVVSKGNHPGLDFSRDFGWKKHFRLIKPSIAKHSQASQHPLSAPRKLGRRQAKSRVLLQLPAAASDPFTEGFSIPNLSVLSSYRPTVLLLKAQSPSLHRLKPSSVVASCSCKIVCPWCFSAVMTKVSHCRMTIRCLANRKARQSGMKTP